MSIHDLFFPNPYDIYANTITVASGVIPPPVSAPTFTVGPPGPLTVNGTTNLNGPLNVVGGQSNTGNLVVSGSTTFGTTGADTMTVNSTSIFASPVNINALTTHNQNVVITPPFQLTGDVFYNNAIVTPNTLQEAGISQVQDALDRIQSYVPRALAQATLTTNPTPIANYDGLGGAILWTPVPTTLITGINQSRPQSNIAAYWATPGTLDGIQGSFAGYGATVVYKATVILVIDQNTITPPPGDFPASITVAVSIGGTRQFSSTALWIENNAAGTLSVSASGMVITSFNSVFTVEAWCTSGGPANCTSCILYVEYDGDM